MNMRQMTPGELYCWYKLKTWPCGHGSKYLPGPRGGIMRNVKCATCAMEMNVVDPTSDFNYEDFPFGQVIEEPDGYRPPPLPGPQGLRERLQHLLRAIRGWPPRT